MPKNQYAIARRSIWYLLRTLLVIALIVVLCLTAFVTAMHISNIYILVTEGLELRAGYILQGGEIAPLTEYFTENFIAQDPALYAGTYSNFNVTNFIYKIEVKSLLTLPGDSTATVKGPRYRGYHVLPQAAPPRRRQDSRALHRSLLTRNAAASRR